MRKMHLICNAHLDPVWLWEWEEGAAEALSTFRVAAEFCETVDGFVFNHNEAILYRWIQQYDPALFQRIRDLVSRGKWHIMGGFHLQPDCNMPAGESILRHMLAGRRYFKENFGAVPTTAINFDSFGHSRGLVQLYKKAGYDSYIICRAGKSNRERMERDFVWVGLDGSELLVHRSDENYNSVRGQVGQELEKWLSDNEGLALDLFLWGIGDHGGGPSRKDLEDLSTLQERLKEDVEIVHSAPEAYFNALKSSGRELERCEKSLNPVAEGCYTSQIRIKQLHRQLENEYYVVEKMASNASLQGLMEYPERELAEALYDLMTSEFHDALPGSSIQPVENATLRLIHHGLEIVARLRAKAFFALSSGQEKVRDGETPVLIFNPHPYQVKSLLECEFVIPSQNWDSTFAYPVMYQGVRRIPCQAEQEHNNFRIDWRKHAVFEVELEPSQMNRFDFKFDYLPQKPKPMLHAENGRIRFDTAELTVEINCETGLLEHYVVHGVEYVREHAFQPVVVKDSFNSWGGIGGKIGEFTLLSPEEGSRFSGLAGNAIESVRVIEDGEVRSVVEAVFGYENSRICLQYKLPKKGTELRVDVRVFWNEKDKALKLAIPTTLSQPKYLGQIIYGVEEMEQEGKEVVSQKWSAVVSETENQALTCINDCIYGSSFRDGEIGLTLLRSSAYASADFPGKPAIPKDRFTPRMDQGERLYSFWINGGARAERLEAVDREAAVRNEKPFALAYCPSGEGRKPEPLIVLDDDTVQMPAFKKAEKGEGYIIRLFEPAGRERTVKVRLPAFRLEQEVSLGKFEVKTLLLDPARGTLAETDLMEGQMD